MSSSNPLRRRVAVVAVAVLAGTALTGAAAEGPEQIVNGTFDNGHAQRVSNQFANSFGDYQTAEASGVGPHVAPMPGAAPITMTGVNGVSDKGAKK